MGDDTKSNTSGFIFLPLFLQMIDCEKLTYRAKSSDRVATFHIIICFCFLFLVVNDESSDGIRFYFMRLLNMHIYQDLFI